MVPQNGKFLFAARNITHSFLCFRQLTLSVVNGTVLYTMVCIRRVRTFYSLLLYVADLFRRRIVVMRINSVFEITKKKHQQNKAVKVRSTLTLIGIPLNTQFTHSMLYATTTYISAFCSVASGSIIILMCINTAPAERERGKIVESISYVYMHDIHNMYIYIFTYTRNTH